MKFINKIAFLLLACCMSVGLTGCWNNELDEEVEEMPDFILEDETLRVKIGAENKEEVRVKVGGDVYQAFALDENVAKAELIDGVVYVEGFSNGTTDVIVSDKYSRYRRLPVSVYTTDELTVEETNFELLIPLGNWGKGKTSVVLGNGGYTIASDNEAVRASIDENTGEITFEAKSKMEDYTANITVTDCTSLTATIVVTVKYSLEAYTDVEKEDIMGLTAKDYTFNGGHHWLYTWTEPSHFAIENGWKFGWRYNSSWYGNVSHYISFEGDFSVGEKANGKVTYTDDDSGCQFPRCSRNG